MVKQERRPALNKEALIARRGQITETINALERELEEEGSKFKLVTQRISKALTELEQEYQKLRKQQFSLEVEDERSGTDWKTYASWEKEGFHVKKGRKATWVDGTPMFNEKQVLPLPDYGESDYQPGAAMSCSPQDW